MIRKSLFTIFLVLAFAVPGWTATYYVSQAGDGDGSTVDVPDSIADFNAGVFGELDNDTVYFLNTINTGITPPDSGTSGHRVALRGDYSGQECTWDGNSSVYWGIKFDGVDFITLDGFTVTEASGDGIGIYEGSDNIIIQNCTVHTNARDGIKTYAETTPCDTVLIYNNTVYANGRSGISVGDKSDNVTVRANTVHENCTNAGNDNTCGIKGYGSDSDNCVIEKNVVYSEGLTLESWRGWGIHADSLGSGGIIRYNKSYNNNLAGIFIEGCSGCEAYGNICYNNGASDTGDARYQMGMAVGGSGAATNTNKIYNNTLYGQNANNDIGISLAGDGLTSDFFDDNEIKNNIIVNAVVRLKAIGGAQNDGDYGSGNVYSHNCLGAEGNDFITWGADTDIDTYDEWEDGSHYNASTNSIESAPLMTDPANGDFTLTARSPCINAGTIPVGFEAIFPLDPRDTTFPYDSLTNDYGSGREIGVFGYPFGTGGFPFRRRRR